MRGGKNRFAVTMRICGMDVAFDHIIVHEAVNEIGTFPLWCAKHKRVPEKIAFINECIGRYALPFPKIFKGIIGIQGVRPNLEFLPITGCVQASLIFSVDVSVSPSGP